MMEFLVMEGEQMEIVNDREVNLLEFEFLV